MNKKFLSIILVLSVLGVGYYAYLGGFDKPEISQVSSTTHYIAGQYYEGPADSEAFGEYFKKAGQVQESGKLAGGTLANIYYNNPEAQTDTIKAFIGIMMADSSAALPPGYQWRTWQGGQQVVRVSTQAHYLLAPNKLYPALFAYLKEHQLKTRSQYLEAFPAKDQAVIEAVLIGKQQAHRPKENN
ncbi:MAG: hypothetical protein ACO1O1_04810 [Adhaeribacter sp.]